MDLDGGRSAEAGGDDGRIVPADFEKGSCRLEENEYGLEKESNGFFGKEKVGLEKERPTGLDLLK